eukprot:g2875.t1
MFLSFLGITTVSAVVLQTVSGQGLYPDPPSYHGCQNDLARTFPYCDLSKTYEERLQSLIDELSLDEKVALISPLEGQNACDDHTSNISRLGLPQYMWLVETNTGVAATCQGEGKCCTTFPGPLVMGSSFNKTSWYKKGSVLGTEMRAFYNMGAFRGVGPTEFIGLTGYGPNLNIARDPRFGRTSELPGEDPLVNGLYGANMVKGMQEEDENGYPKMLAYLKHFTAYSTETNRGHDSYDVSMHDLFDTYLAQYEIAFTEGKPTGAMCSYNAINGHPSCANSFILNQVVRKQWAQTNAHITTDCGAVNNLKGAPVNAPTDEIASAIAINNGTDIEMGGTLWTGNLANAVRHGLVAESTVEQSIWRSYIHHFRAGRFDPPNATKWHRYGLQDINSTESQQIVMEAALQGLVLLRNNKVASTAKSVLPIDGGKTVAVLGPLAFERKGLISDYAGDQLCVGGTYDCIPTIVETVTAANKNGKTVSSIGCDVNSKDSTKMDAAIAAAKGADVVLLAVGNTKDIEHEGQDRTDTKLPGLQEDFAKRVLSELGDIPVVLIMINGGALAIDALMGSPNLVGIIEAYNPNTVGSTALATSIFGRENRWGKLVLTMYPHDYIQQENMTNYDMSSQQGRTYRYYKGKPLFEFSSGLSYTTFSHECQEDNTVLAQSGSRRFQCTIKNTGDVLGDEVLMVFHSVSDGIRSKAPHPIPIKQLKDFERVRLHPGESKDISFEILDDVFEVIDQNGSKKLYKGTHNLLFSRGASHSTSDVEISIQL